MLETSSPRTERGPRSWMAVLSVLVWLSAVCSAHPRFLIDVWTPYDGLPQSRVTGIAQTPDGYLWIATHLGWLSRFDGVKFDHFNPHNTPALVSPEIQALLIDGKGRLVVSDIDGRLLMRKNGGFTSLIEPKPGYDRRVSERIGGHGGEERFLTASGGLLRLGKEARYEDDPTLPANHPKTIRVFRQDSRGVLWCTTVAGRFGTWTDGSFQPAPDSTAIETAGANDLLITPDDTLLLATNDGLWVHGPDGTNRHPADLPESHRRIVRMAAAPDEGVWLLTHGGPVLLRGDDVVRSIDMPFSGATQRERPDLRVDSTGALWLFHTDQGVIRISADGSVSVIDSHNGLPADQVEAWFEDREGNIWLGTVAGLVKLRPRWFHLVDAEASGPGSAVVSISEDAGGSIWLGCAKGLTRWRDGEAEDIPLPRNPFRPNVPLAYLTVAPGDTPGEIWLGSVENGAMKFAGGRIEQPFPFDAAGFAIRTIRRDPEGGIWFGGEFGLFRWDGTSLRKFGPEDGLKPGHIHDISFDANGDAWVAKAEELVVVYRNGRFESVPLPGISPKMRIHTLLCGADDSVYVGTVGGGLLHLTRGKMLQYTMDDGLPGDTIPQLLEDDKGFLWGGTHRGIFRVSTTALDMRSKDVTPPFLFHIYGHSDGLPEAECSGGLQPACWKASDGNLWFSTVAGAVRVDPGDVTKNIHPPHAIIEEFRVNDRPVAFRNARTDVSPGHHRYEFRFTALSTTAPAKAGFQWRLSGVDEDWVEGHDQRSIAYGGLDPGDYQFDVRARNNDGVWSVEPASLAFRVQPFFWQRSSVRTVAALALPALGFLTVAGIMKRRHQRELRALEYERGLEQQRYRHKQAMDAERARIAAELHDDLGANLTQIQWLTDPSNLPGGGGESLIRRISAKSCETVRLIDEIVWAVNPSNDTLEELVTYVCNFAEQYFRDTGTRARMDVAGPVPSHIIKSDVRHQLFLIAKEAFHNAAKHSGADRVWTRISFDNSELRICIEDNGRGFDPTEDSDGDGLANMRRRAGQAGARIDIGSEPDKGTRVTVHLPIDRNPT